jgi:hypothetical protein
MREVVEVSLPTSTLDQLAQPSPPTDLVQSLRSSAGQPHTIWTESWGLHKPVFAVPKRVWQRVKGTPASSGLASRVTIGCVACAAAVILGSVVGYAVIALPQPDGNARTLVILVAVVCGALAIALLSVAFLLFTRPASRN